MGFCYFSDLKDRLGEREEEFVRYGHKVYFNKEGLLLSTLEWAERERKRRIDLGLIIPEREVKID